MPFHRTLLFILLTVCPIARAAARLETAPVPVEMRSSFFAVTVNGRRIEVASAAANYDFVSFGTTGPMDITITAAEPGFWAGGVDIEPWRLGLRARRDGQTIRFRLRAPAELSISRPGDFLNHARMLFVFADTPAPPPPAGSIVIAAGIHRESLNPRSGDTVYLAPGAFVFGSLNLEEVHDVKVLGRGTIVYDGPQNPADDNGWLQRPDWHCIGAYQSHNVEIDGLTCIVRSRTWSIQMQGSTGFRYDDLRVIAGDPANANQDGMDWLGGGDTVVQNAFIRASDDDFALQGNWEGYDQAEILRPGQDVANITIENSELSTSISNVVRVGWPEKIFNSRNFTLRNSDILHAGMGACGQSFGLLGLWGANGARGDHSGYAFENLFLDNWYSLAQIEQEQPAIHGVTLRNIWALGQPPLAPSTLTGAVRDVTLDNVKYEQARATSDAQVPLLVSAGAEQPKFAPAPALQATFTIDHTVITPKRKVTFVAQAARDAHFTWVFGDGAAAHGRHVRHRFPDALGTELDGRDGAGVYRVLLHVTGKDGHQDWAEQNIAVVDALQAAVQIPAATTAGLAWKIYAGTWADLPDLARLTPALTGASPDMEASAQGLTHWATVWDGLLHVSAEGGYIFHLIDRDGARLLIDGREVARTGPAFAQVCGSPGNAQRIDSGAIGLRAGLHTIHVEALNTMSAGAPRLLWEGPGLPLNEIPSASYSRVQ